MPVLDTLAELQRTVTRAVRGGGHLTATMDKSRSGVWIRRSASIEAHTSPTEPKFRILNTLENVGFLTDSAQPLCIRPDAAQDGVWVVPFDDVTPVEGTALRTLEEMQHMAAGLSGAQVLVDGDTAVLKRLAYFMRNQSEEVQYRAIAVCTTMCSHGSRRIEDALKLEPGLVHTLHAAAAPEVSNSERVRSLATDLLVCLGATHPSALDTFPPAEASLQHQVDAVYAGGTVHPGLVQDNTVLRAENMSLLAEREALRFQLRESEHRHSLHWHKQIGPHY